MLGRHRLPLDILPTWNQLQRASVTQQQTRQALENFALFRSGNDEQEFKDLVDIAEVALLELRWDSLLESFTSRPTVADVLDIVGKLSSVFNLLHIIDSVYLCLLISGLVLHLGDRRHCRRGAGKHQSGLLGVRA